jgi:excisionase family DNA binding protein
MTAVASNAKAQTRYATIQAVLRDYGLGRTNLYALLKAGKFRFVKVGSRTLIDIESLEAWFASL